MVRLANLSEIDQKILSGMVSPTFERLLYRECDIEAMESCISNLECVLN